MFSGRVSISTNWKEWSESKLETTIDEGETLVDTLRAIPAPKFTIEETDIKLFQDENCTTPLPQPVGVRVNIRYSDGSNALRMYPAGRKFRIGEQVNPWWETRRPYTRIYYHDLLSRFIGEPGSRLGFCLSIRGVHSWRRGTSSRTGS